MPRPDHTDDELPEFPYDEGNPDSPLPDEDAQKPAASGLDDLRHAKAQLDDDGPTLGEAAKSITKSADLNTDAIQSLVTAVETLGASLPGTTTGQSTTLATPSPETPASETQSKTPPLDLSRVTAGLDRIYSAIVDGKSSSSPAPSAAAPSSPSAAPPSPAPFVSPNLVPGQKSGVDKVPAALTEGEYVMRPEAVKTHGLDFMEEINAAKAPAASNKAEAHALGGVVGATAKAAAKAAAYPEKQAAGFSSGSGDPVKGYSIGGAIAKVGSYLATVPVKVETGREAGGGFGNAYKEATRSAQAPQNAPSIGNSAASAAVSGALTGGPLAGAVAGVVAGFKAVGESANAASKNLESYSAEIAGANQEAIAAQVTSDVDRASVVGEEVGKHTKVTSDISQSNQNLEAGLMLAGLAILNPLLELLEPFIQTFNQFIGGTVAEGLVFLSNILDAVGELIDWANGPMAGVPAGITTTAQDMRRAANGVLKLVSQGDKDTGEAMDIDALMNQFLHGHGMDTDIDSKKIKEVKKKKKPGKAPGGGNPLGN